MTRGGGGGVFTRSFSYVTTSIVVASLIVVHALLTREQYFSAMLYLSTSKISVVALANVAFALAFTMAKGIKRLFLGTLRESEVERLQDRTREAVMETCLAMTIFREEFTEICVVIRQLVVLESVSRTV